MRVLQRQTRRRVGLLRYDATAAGAERTAARVEEPIGKDGDCDSRRAQRRRPADAGRGRSGICRYSPAAPVGHRIAGQLSARELLHHAGSAAHLPQIDGGAVVIAGSCSLATNAQVAAWRDSRPAFRIDPVQLAAGEPVAERAIDWATAILGREPMLIYSTSPADEVKAVQSTLGVEEAGLLVERAMADIARKLYEAGARTFVVAGGEVSGAVVSALGVEMLRIGGRIDPGVPWTAAVGGVPQLDRAGAQVGKLRSRRLLREGAASATDSRLRWHRAWRAGCGSRSAITGAHPIAARLCGRAATSASGCRTMAAAG